MYLLQLRLQTEYDALCKQNELESRRVCEQLLQQLHMDIQTNSEQAVYARPGGYEIYKRDMAILQQKYTQAPGKGIMVG